MNAYRVAERNLGVPGEQVAVNRRVHLEDLENVVAVWMPVLGVEKIAVNLERCTRTRGVPSTDVRYYILIAADIMKMRACAGSIGRV